MKLLKDWYSETASGYETERDAVGTLQSWYNKGNLVVNKQHGSTYGKSVEDIFGLPYTSSSDFAAIWNTNVECHYVLNPALKFEGVAVSESRHIVAYFLVIDRDGNEVGEAYIQID